MVHHRCGGRGLPDPGSRSGVRCPAGTPVPPRATRARHARARWRCAGTHPTPTRRCPPARGTSVRECPRCRKAVRPGDSCSSRERVSVPFRSSRCEAARSRGSVEERPVHTGEVAGSIPAGTTVDTEGHPAHRVPFCVSWRVTVEQGEADVPPSGCAYRVVRMLAYPSPRGRRRPRCPGRVNCVVRGG